MAAASPPRAGTLAIHPGALGDVLLAIPALRALRAHDGPLTVAAQPRIGALLAALGLVDHAVAFDTLGLEALFAGTPLPGGAPLARPASGAERVVCWFGARDESFVAGLRALAPGAIVASPTGDGPLVWEHLLHTVSPAGAADRRPVVVPPELRREGCRALRAIGWDGASRVLIVHPGAGGAHKQWAAAGFADAVARVDATVVVHHGPADAAAVRAFVACVRRPVLSLVDPPLPALAGALAAATAYVGNDSGVSHLAAGLGACALVLFTEPMRRFTPWSTTARCLTVTTGALVDAERDAVAGALAALLP